MINVYIRIVGNAGATQQNRQDRLRRSRKPLSRGKTKNLIVMNKNIFFILCLSAFLSVSYGKHTDSIHLELNLADKASQYSLQSERIIAEIDKISNEYKNTVIVTDSTLNQVVNHIENIVKHTKPGFWKTPEYIAAFAFIISIIACLGTCAGAIWQRRAEENTRAIRQIQKEQQGFLLLDFIRHLYRNKVIVCSLQWQLEGKYNTHYPSDEHILKLQIPLEELELDRFANSSTNFDDIHKLKLLCRNTNIEIGITYEHLKSKNFPIKYKKHNLETLEFKCQHITLNIIQLMSKLNLLEEDKWDNEVAKTKEDKTLILLDYDKERAKNAKNKVDDDFLQKIRVLLYNRIQDNKDQHPSFEDYLKDEQYRKKERKYQRKEQNEKNQYNKKYRYYDDVLQIGDQLNYDIYMEGKGKHDGEGVIKLIKFDSRQEPVKKEKKKNRDRR